VERPGVLVVIGPAAVKPGHKALNSPEIRDAAAQDASVSGLSGARFMSF
jgi:hypothetical protein